MVVTLHHHYFSQPGLPDYVCRRDLCQITEIGTLEQGLADVSFKGTDNKYFQVCGPHLSVSLLFDHAAKCEHSHGQCVNESA